MSSDEDGHRAGHRTQRAPWHELRAPLPRGRRRFVTLGTREKDGWTRQKAETELANVLADVRRGIWQPKDLEPVPMPSVEPTFHRLATDWLYRRQHEVSARSVEDWKWALSGHLLAHFGPLKPSEITVNSIEAFKSAKLVERERREAEIEAWRKENPATRGRMPRAGLSNLSINKCLKTLATVLDEAIDKGWVERNVAGGKKRRLRPTSRAGRGSSSTRCRRSSQRPGSIGR